MDKNSPEYKKYEAYIRSQSFKDLKVELILNRGCKCEKCSKPYKDARGLQVHHKTYIRLYNEEPDDLILLCAKCHMIEHGLLKVKKVKNKKPHHLKKDKKKPHRNPNKKRKNYYAKYPMTEAEKAMKEKFISKRV